MVEELEEATGIRNDVRKGNKEDDGAGEGRTTSKNKAGDQGTAAMAQAMEAIAKQLSILNQRVEQMETLAGTVHVLVGTVGSLRKTVESLPTRVTALEAQNEALLEVARKTATEQVKVI